MLPRLLAGPALAAGPKSLLDHRRRLGPLPPVADRRALIDLLGASGLLGRGGAGFPVARKWAAVADRSAGDAVVLANGAEGEPLSAKDRTLMATRPHLVLDGANLAADAVGAERIVLYVGSEHAAAGASLRRAVAERAADGRTGRQIPVKLVPAPPTYVAGEESAAVHFVNAGDARPTGTTPRPFERGVGARPTLVQNVETLAHAALIARNGDAWYREIGGQSTRGSALVTVGGAAGRGVTEIAIGTTVAELADLAAVPGIPRAVLLGGYFGGWLSADEAMDLPLDPVVLREAGSAFGCGVVSFLDRSACGIDATARIIDYMAGQSAAQCGPCVFGLRAMADATARIAGGTAGRDDLERLTRWSGQLAGRGACRHPDGAVGLMQSALRVFADDFVTHARLGRCPVGRARGEPPDGRDDERRRDDPRRRPHPLRRLRHVRRTAAGTHRPRRLGLPDRRRRAGPRRSRRRRSSGGRRLPAPGASTPPCAPCDDARASRGTGPGGDPRRLRCACSSRKTTRACATSSSSA